MARISRSSFGKFSSGSTLANGPGLGGDDMRVACLPQHAARDDSGAAAERSGLQVARAPSEVLVRRVRLVAAVPPVADVALRIDGVACALIRRGVAHDNVRVS